MTKYIVKNCPEHTQILGYCANANEYCYDIADCAIKQVVELCKRNLCKREECSLEGTNHCSSECCFFYTTDLAEDILQILQVEDVEK